jgi:hypothetical protein
MGTTGKFVLGGIVGLLGILALFIAAAAHSGPLYVAGLIFFSGCFIFIMYLINRAFHDEGNGGAHSETG